MLSFTKTLTTFPSHQIPSTPRPRYFPSFTVIKSSTDENGNNIASSNDLNTPAPVRPPITPPGSVEIRFKRGSRRRRKQQEESAANKMPSKPPPKDWESMTLTEKAIELYVGEKGVLFWLNKFAYASIFIVIGGWILFRFVGPALNLYQLDTPPLAPSSMFKE